jgi:hypothetical protein
MAARSRWRQAAWFVMLYASGVIAVGIVAMLFRLLIPR